jgi:dihydroorotate dehydrogenase (fumarate)
MERQIERRFIMDLSTNYLGLKLASPLVPSASPLSHDLSAVRQMEDNGASAVVLWSLFEEQVHHEASELEHYLSYGAERFPESITYFPNPPKFHLAPEEYLEHIRRARKAVDIPIIGSLNGTTGGGWISCAKQMQEAGASAIELNVYYLPTEPGIEGRSVEQLYIDILREVKSSVTIPVAMKLSPYFSSLHDMAQRLEQAGANGLVLFNRFYQPDIDIHKLETVENLSLSTTADMRLPLRWIAILYGRHNLSLAATSGIYSGLDVAKMVMAGADVTMMCSALLCRGISHLSSVKFELERFMESMGYDSLSQMKGILSHKTSGAGTDFERTNYMGTLNTYGWTATLE